MMESWPSDRAQDRITLGEIIDQFVASCPSPLYGDALTRPAVRRYLVDYVLQRIQWELPPRLLRVDGSSPEAARQDTATFREYVECAIYWGMEEIIRDRLDLSLADGETQSRAQ
jgi:hypothetical protein